MIKFTCAYIPIGVPTFHIDSAREEYQKSVKVLSEITENLAYPDDMLLQISDLKDFLNCISPDIVILQNSTFANSAYCAEVLKRTNCPILLWTLREPVIDGNRLRLNSLTGAYSAANMMYEMGKPFEYIFGAPEEKEVIAKLKAMISAAEIRHSFRSLNIASLGNTPQGFGFGRALDADILKYFGASLINIEVRELMNKANSYSPEECSAYFEQANSKMAGLKNVPKNNLDGFIRLYKAYSEFVEENNIGALASRCWPDFFTEYGTPVCSVLAMLNDSKIAASCEGDVYGAISMYVGTKLTDSPVYFGDPVSLDEGENTLTFWHCGTAACSLARDNNAEVGVHPNRKIGPTMEFGCKPSKNAVIFRIGRKNDGTFRMFIAEGEILDKPKQFSGTSLVVKTKNDVKSIVNGSIKLGFEPHYAVIYGDVGTEIEILGRMMDFEICRF